MTFTLLDLSNEVLTLVCEQLCPHCCPSLVDPDSYASESWWAKRALYRLCRVSKRLNSIATPILYHRFYPSEHSYKMLLAFLRTILERPDLIPHVRQAAIAVSTGEHRPFNSIRETPALMQTVLDNLGLALPPNINPRSRYVMSHLLMQQVIVLLPRLERLYLDLSTYDKPTTQGFWMFDKLFATAESPESIGDPAERAAKTANFTPWFPALTDLDLLDDREHRSPQSFQALSSFLAHAPRLNTLRASGYIGPVGPPKLLPLANVTALHLFHTRFSQAQIRPLLLSCGLLREFCYEIDYDYDLEEEEQGQDLELTPAQAVDLLRRHQDTLEMLQIRFRDVEADQKLTSLKDFPQLRRLKLNPETYSHFNDTGNAEALLRLLPENVQHLGLVDINGREGPSIKELGKQSGLFPHLRQVDVDGEPCFGLDKKEQEDIIATFEATSISLRFWYS